MHLLKYKIDLSLIEDQERTQNNPNPTDGTELFSRYRVAVRGAGEPSSIGALGVKR